MSRFAVLCTQKITWSLRGVEASCEQEAIAKIRALEPDQLERFGHEIDFEVEIDSVSVEPTKKKKK